MEKAGSELAGSGHTRFPEGALLWLGMEPGWFLACRVSLSGQGCWQPAECPWIPVSTFTLLVEDRPQAILLQDVLT